MSDERKPKFKEPVDLPEMKVELEGESKVPFTAEELYLKRQAEVTQPDRIAVARRICAAGRAHRGVTREVGCQPGQ